MFLLAGWFQGVPSQSQNQATEATTEWLLSGDAGYRIEPTGRPLHQCDAQSLHLGTGRALRRAAQANCPSSNIVNSVGIQTDLPSKAFAAALLGGPDEFLPC
ncbi:hypothetical protein ACFL5O_03430 [Myxococcota bacterium]